MQQEREVLAEREKLLFANDAFYAAFNAGDAEAMRALWVEEGPAFCLHPGWSLLRGAEAVLKSWAGIFRGGSSPTITCRGAVPEVLGEIGLVLCYEMLGNNVLAATNVFRRVDGRWRMVHHQAGPCQQPPREILEPPKPPPVQ